jgi:hypothetical protein
VEAQDLAQALAQTWIPRLEMVSTPPRTGGKICDAKSLLLLDWRWQQDAMPVGWFLQAVVYIVEMVRSPVKRSDCAVPQVLLRRSHHPQAEPCPGLFDAQALLSESGELVVGSRRRRPW